MDNAEESQLKAFQPWNCTTSTPAIQLPGELWITVIESSCTFSSEIFLNVMLNLVKNPNITSSHLFRADIIYDRENGHASGCQTDGDNDMISDYQPRELHVPGYDLYRTLVRRLIPRNPQLDNHLVQTCQFFQRKENDTDEHVVLYIPHISEPEHMPFYHPQVSHLAFVHKQQSRRSVAVSPSKLQEESGSISISFCLFPNTDLTPKLGRTALRLLQTVYKHGQGQLAGYEKRVHHDQIIPQKRYQDTYARLKARYGRHLSESWVEVTDPGKHVFEDIGIAAFLIELWREMYDTSEADLTNREQTESQEDHLTKVPFPGFVDIGCGNGLLVYILLMEGYQGWGFDARERRTWNTFPENVQERLQQRLLIPSVFRDEHIADNEIIWHNGMFSKGTFIISNHADELTTWTPLLAYLNQSSFIAIPCCSHDLAGARFRAPASIKQCASNVIRLPQQENTKPTNSQSKSTQAAETGSLKRTEGQRKMPSAYSTLCSYVAALAEEVGFKSEQEILRIPSTRNHCVVGRYQESTAATFAEDLEQRKRKVVEITEGCLRKDVQTAGADWIKRAQILSLKPGSGH